MIEDVNKFNILTNDVEKQERLNLCNSCVENKKFNSGNLCYLCACPIEYVISYKFKICPLKKWSIE